MALLSKDQGDTRGPAADPARYSGWERINQGAFAVAYKAVRAGQPVFFKQYINPKPLSPWYHAFIAYQEKLVARIRNTPALAAMCIYPIDHFDYQGVLRFPAAPGKTPATVPVREYCQVTKWVDGMRTFAYFIENRDTAGPASLITTARQLTAAIAVLHKAGIVHGDLKPENIILTPQAGGTTLWIRIIDLDFALLEGETIPWQGEVGFVGTPGWMSPEHLREPQVQPTAASDVFTVALMLNALIGEGHPFREPPGGRYREGGKWELGDAVIRGRFEPCQLLPALRSKVGSKAVEDALNAALHPDPARRPTLEGLAGALGRLRMTDRPEVKAIRVTYGGRELARIDVSMTMNRAWLLRLGVPAEDADYMSDLQYNLRRGEEGWFVEHHPSAIHPTLLNDRPVRGATLLQPGAVVSVGLPRLCRLTMDMP